MLKQLSRFKIKWPSLPKFIVQVQHRQVGQAGWINRGPVTVGAYDHFAAVTAVLTEYEVEPGERLLVWAPGAQRPRIFQPGGDPQLGLWEDLRDAAA